MEELLNTAKKVGYTPIYYKISTIEERRAVQSDPEFWKAIVMSVKALAHEYGSDHDPSAPNFRYSRDGYKNDPNFKTKLLDTAYKLHEIFWRNYYYSGERMALNEIIETLKRNYTWNEE